MYVSAFKVALVLNDWISEKPEKSITETWSIYPGDLASRVDLAEWLITSARELSRLFRPEDTHRLSVLAERIHHGVREDVLGMMKLEGVGRKRGRALYNAGFRSISDLAMATEEQLTDVPGIGRALAKSIKEQVGGRKEHSYWEV
jgi:helicase